MIGITGGCFSKGLLGLQGGRLILDVARFRFKRFWFLRGEKLGSLPFKLIDTI